MKATSQQLVGCLDSPTKVPPLETVDRYVLTNSWEPAAKNATHTWPATVWLVADYLVKRQASQIAEPLSWERL